MPVPELLKNLLTVAGPSGHETGPAQVWREYCAGFAAEVGGDRVGSSYAIVRGTGDGPRVAVVGHIDEIGLHVSHIEDDGYLRFGQVGGWDAGVLIGQRVKLRTRDGDLIGVIGRKPVHLLKDEDRKKVPELKELHIDIGAKNGDEARSLVRIGDVGVIDADPIDFRHGRVVSRSLDNRVGSYVAA
ncbi:MAG TPA: M42 family peptidase, partial [Solirubrobacteraceae bacterium]|nr:M42 family peptidase [Solirubrobacteraceae bacterium]